MKTLFIILSWCTLSVIVLLSAGCMDPGVIQAAAAAMGDTTESIQGRYSQSPYYNTELPGQIVDNIGGYNRYPGKFAVYNRLTDPIKADVIGVIAPGSMATYEFYASVSNLGIYNLRSNETLGHFEAFPSPNGRVIIVAEDGIEER